MGLGAASGFLDDDEQSGREMEVVRARSSLKYRVVWMVCEV